MKKLKRKFVISIATGAFLAAGLTMTAMAETPATSMPTTTATAPRMGRRSPPPTWTARTSERRTPAIRRTATMRSRPSTPERPRPWTTGSTRTATAETPATWTPMTTGTWRARGPQSPHPTWTAWIPARVVMHDTFAWRAAARIAESSRRSFLPWGVFKISEISRFLMRSTMWGRPSLTL